MDKSEELKGSVPSTSSEARVAVSVSTSYQNKRVPIHKRLANDFHEHKYKYLKEEHKNENTPNKTGNKDGERNASQMLHKCMNLE